MESKFTTRPRVLGKGARNSLVITTLAILPSLVVAIADRHVRDGDISFFVKSGDTLLSGAWVHTFADVHLQAGPLQLLLFSLLDRLPVPLSVLVECGVATLVVLSVSGARARLLVGAAAAFLGLTHFAFSYGHPAEVAIPVLWLVAARIVRRHPLAAGLLVGASAGFEVWGLLGVAVPVLASGPRAMLVASTAATAVAICLFVPFLVGGDFHMFDYQWQVAPGTLASLVVAHGSAFGWPLRVLQGGLSVAAGAGAACLVRRRRELYWLVPLAVIGVRLALDPIYNPWYLLAAETVGLVAAASFFPLVFRRAGAAHPPVKTVAP